MSAPTLLPGDPAPRFVADSSLRPAHSFDVQAGRYLVLTFVGSEDCAGPGWLSDFPEIAPMTRMPVQHWFVLREPLPANSGAPIRYFLDPLGEIARNYLLPPETVLATFVLTPRLHIAAIISTPDREAHVREIERALSALPPVGETIGTWGSAPVLVIPGVFEPEFCRMLIEGYERNGGHDSHFAREENGRTVNRLDPGFKVRRDWFIGEPAIQRQIEARFARRVVPEIRRAFQFHVEHLERHLVACYEATDGGHFAAHRDDTTRGTEHRRFACSLNLNDDYEGGAVIFPEFGTRQFRPAPGACVIFSASLLHQANRVTAGRRFAYLPFLHDRAAEAVFARNKQFIDNPAIEGLGEAGSG